MRRSLDHVLLLLLATTGAARGQVTPAAEAFAFDRESPAAGHWVGTIMPATGRAVFAALALERGPSGWSAELTFLPAAMVHAPAREVAVVERQVALELATGGGTLRLEGEVSEDGQRLRGTAVALKDGAPQAEPAVLELARTPRTMDLAQPTAWTGIIEIAGAGSLAMTFAVAQTPAGNWVGHMDVPGQGLLGFPLVHVTRTEGRLVAEALVTPSPPVRIEAEIAPDGLHLRGRFRQGPYDLAFDFERNDGYTGPKLRRPQHPVPPYPYTVHEVRIAHPDGHMLAGTLTVPEGEGPFAAAIAITGSGPQDRDETLLGHKPFLVLADYLTRHGIAVLRCDDRGVGGSGGDFATATTATLATDALAALRFLKTRAEIDAARIGLIGHSEGALIAPMTAGMDPAVAFVVLMAGPAVNGQEILRVQSRLILEASGAAPEKVAELGAQQELIFGLLRRGVSQDELREGLRPVIEAQLALSGAAEGADPSALLEQQVTALSSPWMRYFLAYDPAPALAALRCPVLALNGELDLQVWHEQNLDRIKSIIESAGGQVTVTRYPGLNHLFQPATTGAFEEYGQIETTIDERVLRDIVSWIDRILPARP
jgi:hypothetical protein